MPQNALSVNPLFPPTQVVQQLKSGQIFYVKASPNNGVLLVHPHYTEVVGPDAAVGGVLDLDCARIIPLGDVALTYPESLQRKRNTFLNRRKWIVATKKAVNDPVPLRRAKIILVMMSRYFGYNTVCSLEDEVLASIVGVLPKTMALARQDFRPPKPKTQKPRKTRQVVSNG
ncbi:hypothetical protein PN462_22420 [Spirulina sp. CS-785/01]|uniref:hypothetical protein n=1 Tax=Spirulina sp. CS-785/01 TaxID=3021716 RepID=UPI002330CA28|nr:hypothetical protein [Spirulina sp. CS-785/01]MDB9315884.1 hypothetical protein [Spirulina sp. CS-785/01]